MKARQLIGRVPLALAMCAVSVVAAIVPGSAAQAADCSIVALYSKAAGRYVSAELGYTGSDYGMLRARATSIGEWERFELCWGRGTQQADFTLRSLANWRYVSAELAYTGSRYAMLRARASSYDSWEIFNGASGWRSKANWKLVSAELGNTGGYYGMLRARASTAGPWEAFEVRYI